jgi:hypothetical protein
VFIPGDHAYLRNNDFKDHPEHWQNNAAYAGENLIYTGISPAGADLFWGFMTTMTNQRLSSWENDIRDEWPTEVGFSGHGTPQLDEYLKESPTTGLKGSKPE